MSTSQTAKLRRRAEQAEAVVLGAGFLLQKLAAKYGHDFGVGMDEQVSQAIRDCRVIAKAAADRAATKETT